MPVFVKNSTPRLDEDLYAGQWDRAAADKIGGKLHNTYTEYWPAVQKIWEEVHNTQPNHLQVKVVKQKCRAI